MTLELIETALPTPPHPAAMEERETRRDIAQWISALPTKQREAVRLKFEAGLSYQQISEILETSVGNVGTSFTTASAPCGNAGPPSTPELPTNTTR